MQNLNSTIMSLQPVLGDKYQPTKPMLESIEDERDRINTLKKDRSSRVLDLKNLSMTPDKFIEDQQETNI